MQILSARCTEHVRCPVVCKLSSVARSLSPTEVGMLSGGFSIFLLHSGGGGGKGGRMCSVQRYRWLCSLPSAGGLTLENWEGWQSLGGGLHVLRVIPMGFRIE